jgi:hypothetical protein
MRVAFVVLAVIGAAVEAVDVVAAAPGTIAFCGTGLAFGEMSEGSDTRRKGLVIPAGVSGALVEAVVGLLYGMNGVGGVSAWSSS